jgi:hypothetical protein
MEQADFNDFERVTEPPFDDADPSPGSTKKQKKKAPPPDEPTVDSGKRKGPYKFTLARDITAASTIKTFLIDGFLGRNEISVWFGEPECGKSTAKIDAACHVATGRPWCGRPVTQGPVLYVAAERGQVVKRRILAWRIEHEIDDFPLAVIDDAVDLRGQVDTGRIIQAAKALGTMCKQPVVWIIFDTLSRVMAGGDESSSKDMGQLVLSVDRVFRETAAHCSLVHHVPLGNAARMRGHTSLAGAVDNTRKRKRKSFDHNGKPDPLEGDVVLSRHCIGNSQPVAHGRRRRRIPVCVVDVVVVSDRRCRVFRDADAHGNMHFARNHSTEPCAVVRGCALGNLGSRTKVDRVLDPFLCACVEVGLWYKPSVSGEHLVGRGQCPHIHMQRRRYNYRTDAAGPDAEIQPVRGDPDVTGFVVAVGVQSGQDEATRKLSRWSLVQYDTAIGPVAGDDLPGTLEHCIANGLLQLLALVPRQSVQSLWISHCGLRPIFPSRRR